MNAPQNPGTQLAALNVTIPALLMDEGELIRVLESSVYPGAKLESIKLAIGYCKANHLDPLTKPVHIVPMRVKQPKHDRNGNELPGTEYAMRDVIMAGIELYRTKAVRTGVYAGLSRAEYGPTINGDFGGDDKTTWDSAANAKVKSGTWPAVKLAYPEWCEIIAYRMVDGVKCEFPSGRVYWKETYATASNETGTPNAMWTKRPFGQLEKCAEAMALRRAFPELGGQQTREEMEGKVIDDGVVIDGGTGEVIKPRVPGPQAKSEVKREPENQQEQSVGAQPKEAVDRETGEVTHAGNGNGAEATDDRPMLPGQIKILKAKLANASLTDTDLKPKFGRGIDDKGWLFSDFPLVQSWINERSAQSS